MVKLDEMTSPEFQKYLSVAIKNYADEHVEAGNWDEGESMGKAAQEFEDLLPDGEKTVNHHLFTIRDHDKEVGMIWLAQRTSEKGFIFDINIWDDYQGKGYGKKAMKAIETVGKELGLKSIGLHVFAHNKIARHLYNKLGYIETDISMVKQI